MGAWGGWERKRAERGDRPLAQARSAALAAPWGDGPGRRSWGGYGRFFGFQSILST